jgi:hypothetical protein
MPSDKYSLFYVLNKPKNLPKHKEFILEKHSGLAEMMNLRSCSHSHPMLGQNTSTGRSLSEDSLHSTISVPSSRIPTTDNSDTVEADCPEEISASPSPSPPSPPAPVKRRGRRPGSKKPTPSSPHEPENPTEQRTKEAKTHSYEYNDSPIECGEEGKQPEKEKGKGEEKEKYISGLRLK